jgi:hypothetical protein
VWGTSASDVWAVGTNGTLLHYAGDAWAVLDAGIGTSSSELYGVWGSSPNDIWIVGDVVVRWNGSAFTKVTVPGIQNVVFDAVWGSGPNDVWLGAMTLAEHYDGQTWTQPNVPFSSFDFQAFYATSPTSFWVASYFQVSHLDGTTWTEVATDLCGSHPEFRGIWGSSASDIWVVGDCAGHFDGNQWKFEGSFATGPLSDVWGTAGGPVWVVGRDAIWQAPDPP